MEKRLTEAERLRQQERLDAWKEKIADDEAGWAEELDKMDWREELFHGTKKLKPATAADEDGKDHKCYHVRNVIQENIETMIDSHIPAPKVIPLRKTDEGLAQKAEHLLKYHVMRQHLRVMNDLAERVVYVQGGAAFLAEWDNAARTPDGFGDVRITLLHPRQLVPQDGIFSDIPDMDHCTVKLAMTKQEVLRRYGVDVSDKQEQNAEVRGQGQSTARDLVTVNTVFYRNDQGSIGMFSWTEDTVLADYEDYLARRVRRCKQCGAVDRYAPAFDEAKNEEAMLTTGEKQERAHRCAYCEGTEFEDAVVDEEEIILPKVLMSADGKEIPLQPADAWLDRSGKLHLEPKTKVPYYKPDIFPIVLQKNVSRFGKLLGESDVDRMEDAQNTLKRLDQKILDRLVKAGTKILLPPDTHMQTDTKDSEVIRVDKPAEANMIRTVDFSGDISSLLAMAEQSYEVARQQTGVTDSMQGRRDPTATSARAKEFAANKSEGRMESKRVLKREAWAKIYEAIFKLFLANADQPLHLRLEQTGREPSYETFDRMDFLKQDEDGRYYYETGFIFDCDDAVLLGDSREAMWRELKEAFNGGTLGDPAQIATRILYWGLLEEQGYPGAADIKRKMEEQAERERMALQQAPIQAQQGTAVPPGVPATPGQV